MISGMIQILMCAYISKCVHGDNDPYGAITYLVQAQKAQLS